MTFIPSFSSLCLFLTSQFATRRSFPLWTGSLPDWNSLNFLLEVNDFGSEITVVPLTSFVLPPTTTMRTPRFFSSFSLFFASFFCLSFLSSYSFFFPFRNSSNSLSPWKLASSAPSSPAKTSESIPEKNMSSS